MSIKLGRKLTMDSKFSKQMHESSSSSCFPSGQCFWMYQRKYFLYIWLIAVGACDQYLRRH